MKSAVWSSNSKSRSRNCKVGYASQADLAPSSSLVTSISGLLSSATIEIGYYPSGGTPDFLLTSRPLMRQRIRPQLEIHHQGA